MTLEERIEKAIAETRLIFWGEVDGLPAIVQAAIEEAFPELFDGTHWLAPMEPDKELIIAGVDAIDNAMDSTTDSYGPYHFATENTAAEAYRAFRDHVLNRDKKE